MGQAMEDEEYSSKAGQLLPGQGPMFSAA